MPSHEKPHNKLIVFGSVVQDLVTYVDRFPRPGESVRGKCFKTFLGGKGANQAVMAAKLGADVVFVARVGNDMFGDANIKGVEAAGCDVSLVQKSDSAATGTGVVTVSSDGENCIVVTLAANLEITEERARELEPEIAKANLISCQSEIGQCANLEAFKIAKKYNVTTFFNSAPGRSDLNKEIITYTDIICANENETEFLIGEKITSLDGFKEAAKKILKLGPKFVIITLGPNGAIIAQKHQNTGEVTVDMVPAPKVTAVDTLGAGDCFCGALAYFILSEPNGNFVDHVSKAVHIATISVQRQGPQSSYPSKEELLELNLFKF